MASTPDHMAGINAAVPKWDPSNPDKYVYDPRQPYDRADYEKFRQARLARDQARNAKSAADLKKTMKDVSGFLKDKARPNRPLEWDGESSCFAALEYDPEAGGVWADFHRGGTYFYPMARAEALEWFDDESAGGYFNDAVR